MGDVDDSSVTLSLENKLDMEVIEKDIEREIALCKGPCSFRVLTQKVSKALRTGFKSAGVFTKRARGYVVIVSAMVASAAVISQLTSVLSENHKVLAQFLTIASIWGFSDIGAPIVRPISSRVTKLASRIAYGAEQVSRATSIQNKKWNAIYYRNQNLLDITGTMGRTIVNQFLSTTHFTAAHNDMVRGDLEHSAGLIAATAIKQRRSEEEITADDEFVAFEAISIFSSYVKEKQKLNELVWEKLAWLEKRVWNTDVNEPKVKTYYEALLRAWWIQD